MAKRTFIIIILFSFSIIGNAQNYYNLVNYSMNDGLFDSRIHCTFQDSRGYIWAGTNSGPFRYDAYEFKYYCYDEKDSSSVSNGVVYDIFEDSQNRLWFSCSEGLSLYQPETDNFKNYTHNNSQNSINSNRVSCVREDKNGGLWVGTSEGLNKFNIQKEIFEHFLLDDSLQNGSNYIYCMYVTDSGIFVGYGNNGSCFFSFEENSYSIISANKFTPQRVNNFVADSKGNLWMCAEKNYGLYAYDKKQKQFIYYTDYLKPKNKITNVNTYDIVEDEHGNLWVGTSGGIFIYNYENKIFSNINSNDLNMKGLTSNTIIDFFKDKIGGIWAGTWKGGITYYHPLNNRFKTIKNDFSSFSRMRSNQISCLTNEKNKLWIGTYKGLYIYDSESQKLSVFDHESINEMEINDILVDNNIFVATHKGLYVFSREGKLLKHFSTKNKKLTETLSSDYVTCLFLYDNSFLWIGTSKGINILDTKTWQIHRSFPEGTRGELVDNRVKYFMLDSKGDLWICQYSALQVYNFDTKSIQTYLSYDHDPNSKLPNMLNCIYEDSKERIWIGTPQGLVLFNKNNKHKIIKFGEFLHHNNILGILEDEQNRLWVNSDIEIHMYDSDSISKEPIVTMEGVDNNFYMNLSSCKTDNNKFFFGGKNGINIIESAEFDKNMSIPTIVFTDFKVFSKSYKISKLKSDKTQTYLLKEINHLELIKLKYYQNQLTFSFAALNYISSQNNEYSYMLEGLDKDWSVPDKKREVTYTNLTHGKYIFKVKASNNDGIWNEKGKSLIIIIKPPFWKTWAFRIILFVIIVLILVTYYLIKTRNMRLQNIKLTQMVKKRTYKIDRANKSLKVLNATKDKFFSIIAHDLRNPFMGIMNFSDTLIKDFDKIEKEKRISFLYSIHKSSKGAYNLLENLLTWARSQTGKIEFNPEIIDLSIVVNDTITVLSLNAEKKDITITSTVEKNSRAFADMPMLKTIVRNILNNSIKFTPNLGIITISDRIEEEYSILSIKDNGVGMDESTIDKLFKIDQQTSTQGTSGEAGTGIGLLVCKEFIDKNNGKIEVKSQKGIGSEFIIKLPVFSKEELDNTSLNIDSGNIITDKKVSKTQKELNTVLNKPANEHLVVLIVEDDFEIRMNIKEFLSPHYTLLEAENGNEGYEKAIENIPDLIVSDIMMPEFDGLELSNKIKNNEKTSHIPIILLTAKSSVENKVEGLNSGADDYLTKPFDKRELIARINTLIANREKLIEKFKKEIFVEPASIKITTSDEKFLEKAIQILEDNMANPDFDVVTFTKLMNMSQMQLYRKLKAVVGMTVAEFIRTFRLKRATQLLKDKQKSISEISYDAGFKDPSNFSKIFKKQFGVLPSEYYK